MLTHIKLSMPYLIKLFFTLSLLVCFCSSYAINLGRIQPDEVAYYVQDLKTGKVLAEHHSTIPMSPASTMKLVTTFAAFKSLGENYQWVTSWSSDAPINNGSLAGNLYWKGTYDPVFDQKDLLNMQVQLTQKGIHQIDGDLVLDKTLKKETYSSYGFDKDKNKSFTVAPDPHNLAYKIVWLYYYLDNNQQNAIDVDPPLPNNMLNVQIRSNPNVTTCSSLDSYIKAHWSENKLNIYGNIPPSCVGEAMYLNILDIDEFVKYSFISYWQQLGNTGPKNVVVAREPIMTKILAINYSPKLNQIIKSMNKYSNNLIARSVFLELGKKNNLPASKAISNILHKEHIDTQHFFTENGSGLSRTSQITTKMLGQVLYASYHSSFKNAMLESLPIAGVDGTLKKRLTDIPNLHLKTGTLDNVHALAGYWLPSNPNTPSIVIVAILNQKHNTNLVQSDLDKLVRSILEDISDNPPKREFF